jgi:hypothetical protein
LSLTLQFAEEDALHGFSSQTTGPLKSLIGRSAKLDLKEEEVARNHFSSSTTTQQNAPWKQESSMQSKESELA